MPLSTTSPYHVPLPTTCQIYLDTDVYVIQPNLVHSLLTSTLRLADVAMPTDPNRCARVAGWILYG